MITTEQFIRLRTTACQRYRYLGFFMQLVKFEPGEIKGGAGEGEFQHHLASAALKSVLRCYNKHYSDTEQFAVGGNPSY